MVHAAAYREEVTLGRKASVKTILLSGSAGQRYQLGIHLPGGPGRQQVLCSARMIIVDNSEEDRRGCVRDETIVIDGFQLQGKQLSVEQVFDVPELSSSASVHLEIELGPVSSFRRVQAEISVVHMPQSARRRDSDALQPRRICHLRASSRHFDENTDLPIANEYCGGEESLLAPAQPSTDFASSLPATMPSMTSVTTSSASPTIKKGGGLLGWASQFRRQPDWSSYSPEGASDDAGDEVPARGVLRSTSWGWGRPKRTASREQAAREHQSGSANGEEQAKPVATAAKSPKV